MADRPWKKLVRELRDEGFESPYLDRLRERLDVAAAQEQLEVEIVREMAQALGRAEEKVLVALLRLDVAARDIDRAADGAERGRLVLRYNEFRSEALAARHELLVHREAVGIRRNQVLESLYPVPSRR